MNVNGIDALSLGIGLALGYLIGWHRGIIQLRLVPRIWSKKTAGRAAAAPATSPAAVAGGSTAQPANGSRSSSDETTTGEEDVEQTEQLGKQLAVLYPELTSAQRDNAVREILAKGHEMFGGRIR